ncbi:MAG: hypothetical protein Q7U39_10110 [Nitrospira sp.]|nr:hypothetical protein [Nitrospira sp.]
MPVIKYYGSNRPGSIKEHVYYEDPRHPCFQGRHEAWVSVCRACEDSGVPRSQWNACYLEHILESPYEGMNYVGGVGVVDSDQVFPFDRAISSEEYEELKRVILSANEAYSNQLIATRNAQNDPNRRADPEHEHNRWRTRIWIESYTELTCHVAYRVDQSCHAYARVRQYFPDGMTRHLVDLYHLRERNIGEAIYDGLERAERLVDLLALAGFGAASVCEVVGTSPSTCREGLPFEIATLQARIENTPVPIDPEALENARVGEADHLPLRLLREGLSAKLPTASLASYWNALERQADDQARESGARRTVSCQKCGDMREVGWDIKKSFEAMYAAARVDADFDQQRSLRGRIQHGDTCLSSLTPSELLLEVSRLQRTAIVSVSNRIGLLPQTGEYLVAGVPVSVFECTIEGGLCTVNVRKFEVGAVPSLLPIRASHNGRRAFRAGLDLPPKINPLVLPPMEHE